MAVGIERSTVNRSEASESDSDSFNDEGAGEISDDREERSEDGEGIPMLPESAMVEGGQSQISEVEGPATRQDTARTFIEDNEQIEQARQIIARVKEGNHFDSRTDGYLCQVIREYGQELTEEEQRKLYRFMNMKENDLDYGEAQRGGLLDRISFVTERMYGRAQIAGGISSPRIAGEPGHGFWAELRDYGRAGMALLSRKAQEEVIEARQLMADALDAARDRETDGYKRELLRQLAEEYQRTNEYDRAWQGRSFWQWRRWLSAVVNLSRQLRQRGRERVLEAVSEGEAGDRGEEGDVVGEGKVEVEEAGGDIVEGDETKTGGKTAEEMGGEQAEERATIVRGEAAEAEGGTLEGGDGPEKTIEVEGEGEEKRDDEATIGQGEVEDKGFTLAPSGEAFGGEESSGDVAEQRQSVSRPDESLFDYGEPGDKEIDRKNWLKVGLQRQSSWSDDPYNYNLYVYLLASMSGDKTGGNFAKWKERYPRLVERLIEEGFDEREAWEVARQDYGEKVRGNIYSQGLMIAVAQAAKYLKKKERTWFGFLKLIRRKR